MIAPIRVSGTPVRSAMAATVRRRLARGREAELVVVAAGEQTLDREAPLRAAEQLIQERGARHGWHVDGRPDGRALENVRKVADEAVGDVEGGGCDAAQGNPERDPRNRRLEPRTRRGQRVGDRAPCGP